MKKALTALSLALALTGSTAVAQETATPVGSPDASPVASPAASLDLDALSAAVLSSDAEATRTALETPPDVSELPEGFSEIFVEEQGLGLRALFEPDVALGYMVPYTAPAAVGTSTTDSLGFGYTGYMWFADEVDSAKLDELQSTYQTEIDGNDDLTNTIIEKTEYAGRDALLVTQDELSEDDQSTGMTYILMVPVGNVLVITDLTVSGMESFDSQALLGETEALLETTLKHLESAVNQ